MKLPLSISLIERLSVATRPVFDSSGRLKDFAPVENKKDQKPFIVFDTDRASPLGLGVKVGATKKTFIVQRRVGSVVVKTKIGDLRDFKDMKDVREKAKRTVQLIEQQGRNPNAVAREQGKIKTAAKTTVAEAFAIYREHMVNRANKPAKASSLKNFDLACRRLERDGVKLAHRELGTILEAEVVKAFDNLAASPRPPHPLAKNQSKAKKKPGKAVAGENDLIKPRGIRTATEQTFRWATVATAFVIASDQREANLAGRKPSMTHNPFDALKIHKRYRDRETLEKAYKVSKARNPMQLRDGSLARFLDALWERRKVYNNQTAADYLLLTLLWGMRRGEAASLKWRDRITDDEAAICSWVCLKTRLVHLHDTKNRTVHELPLAPAALEMLTKRREAKVVVPKDRRQWVFPARSSKAVQGHYLDSKSILAGIKESGAIAMLRTHDLRRTFATVAEEMTSYAVVKRLLNHRSLTDVTGTAYIEVGDERLLEAMARIERAMLNTAPIVATALLPLPV